MEWDIYAYELARDFFEFLSAEFLAYLKEEMGMANALQVEEFAAGVVDMSGNPLSGGKVYTYEAGTAATDKATYTDAAMVTPEANPIILDGAGCKNVYAYGNYKFKIYDASDVLIRTLDNQYYMIPSTTALVANTITANYNAGAVNQIIQGNTASGSLTIYLPTAVGNEGCRITAIKISANNTLTLDANALHTQTINGASTFALGDLYEAVEVVSDNSNWVVINSNASSSVTASSTTTLTNKTITAPVLSGTVSGTYVLGGTKTMTVEAWTGFDPTADWTETSTLSYMKDPMGFVHLKGIATLSTSPGSAIIYSALASGYRPEQTYYFVHYADGAADIGQISTVGVITAGTATGTTVIVSLDGITYKAA